MSEDIFGEGGAINELSESVHMGLFLVMLIFLVTVLLLVQFGTEIVSRWQAWEDTILAEAQVRERYHSIHDKTHGAWDFCAGLDHAVLGLEPEEFQEAAYAALNTTKLTNELVDRANRGVLRGRPFLSASSSSRFLRSTACAFHFWWRSLNTWK